jgi:hypothetical protein
MSQIADFEEFGGYPVQHNKVSFLIFLVGFSYAFYDDIMRYIWHTPGVGVVKNIRKKMNVETEIGTLTVPTFQLPLAHEIEILVFKKSIPIEEDHLLPSKSEFHNLYGECKKTPLKKYRQHFIPSVIHTRETKENKVTVSVSSLTEMHVMMVTFEDEFIDYVRLFEAFLRLTADLEEEFPLDDEVLREDK